MLRDTIVTNREVKTEVLVRYKIGIGGRPANLIDEGRVVEKWVPIEETFIRDGKLYWRCLCGHGDSVDIFIARNYD